MSENEKPFELVPPSAIEAISRAEVDIAVSTARRYPRELSVVKQKMMSFATLDEATAESCFYSLPRGGKVIQGPSVRLAEIAVSCYGNLRAGSRIISTITQGDTPHVVVQAVAMDLENNIFISIEKRRRITKKKNKDHIDEDDINLAANACSAIAFRDATFKVVPLALIKPVFEAARKVAIGDARTLADRRTRCLDTFTKMGIDKSRVLAKVEKKTVEEIDLADIELMIGLYNAIKEGEVQLDEAFPVAEKRPENLGPQNGGQKPTVDSKPDTSKASATQPPKTEQAKSEPKTDKESAKIAVPAPKEEAKEPPKTVQEPSNAAEATQTRSEAEKPQAEPAAASQKASGDPAQEEQAPATAVGGDDLPEFITPRKDDTDAVASIKLLCAKAGVSGRMLRNWLESKKLIRGEQRQLSELASTKLDALNRTFPQKVAEMKALGAK